MNKSAIKFWIVFLVVSIVGFLLARLDTAENWDDTGIMVGAILLSTFLFGVILPKYAWLWASLIGGAIFCLNVFQSGNYGSSVAILFAFTGSYAGSLFRKFILTSSKK